MMPDFDLAIVGSGFGGSLLAMVTRRLGLSVLLLERGRHPRFAIGESTSPLANLLLEQLAERYELPRLKQLASFGPWQRAYPDIGCGLKRGFTYFRHTAGHDFQDTIERTNQLMVAASPRDEIADTHWLRADVDAFLVGEAVAAGTDYQDEAVLAKPDWHDGGAMLSWQRHGQAQRARARLVVDATGPGGFLSRALNLPNVGFADYPATQALYSHFTGVHRCDAMPAFQTPETPPYPMDDAALHHVFDGGWMWVLRFGNGLVSAGIAVTDTLAEELSLSDGAAAWNRFLHRYPTIRAQFAGAQAVRPFIHAPRLTYRSPLAAGPGWAMLPSAAAFVDPLFSTGIPLTLLGIERLGRILEDAWGNDDLNSRLQDYAATTLSEADTVADFIAGCYGSFDRFPIFAALSQFYFAAASYSEMARRLDRPHLVRRFLAADHPTFGPALRRCAAKAQTVPLSQAGEFHNEVAKSIARLNVAGLCDPRKRHWYGVDLTDVVTGAAKLGLTPPEMRRIIETATWT